MALTREQEQLLQTLAETSKRLPDRSFIVLPDPRTGGEIIFGGDIPNLEGIVVADVRELERAGLVRITRHTRHGFNAEVTNEGFAYVDALAARAPGPVLVEQKVALVQRSLPEQYRAAQRLIDEAAGRLHQAKADTDFSEIGHKCREALQEFALVLYNQWVSADQRQEWPKEKTVSRVRAVLDAWKDQIGKTSSAFADALLVYWGTVTDLGQKLEHRSDVEQRPLTFNDARRAVLYSWLVMAELAELAPPGQQSVS